MNVELLERLSNTNGVAGNETEVRELIKNEIKNFVDEIKVDALGNLITLKKGRKNRPKVMLAAHMDEVGLMVTLIEKTGFLRFVRVGGIDERILLAKHILVGKEKIPGVISAKPIHLTWRKEEDKKVAKIEELYLDIGASTKEEVEKFVRLGDYVAFATRFEDLGRVVKGKAFDDRIGCYVLIEILKENYDFPLYGVFTVQEEVGLRGARVAGFSVEPDIAFALEGTAAGDAPQKKDLSPATILGRGPAITTMDRSIICDKELVELLVKTAEEKKIPYQFKRPGVGGTDVGRIHLAKEGAKGGVVAVPCRYIHSPVSLANKEDIDNTIKLMKETLKKLEI
ncbi:MAG: M42 family metallopeptidase [Candidatus Edwardsbacteria bacterium]